MRESILPRMYTATQDTVLGGVIQHVNSKKMVIVLGEPGEGKTVTMLDFCTQYPHPAYYYLTCLGFFYALFSVIMPHIFLNFNSVCTVQYAE